MSLRRESPIRGRRLRFDEALMERALMSPAGYRFLVHVAPRIDKMVIPRTNGRLSSVGIDRVGLVTTTGAKSGLPRTHPLVLLDDSDGLLAIGSNYGRPPHPAWSSNLLAHPECTVEFLAPPAQYRAELLTGDARASAWAMGTTFTPVTSATEQNARHARSGSFASGPSPADTRQPLRYLEFMACSTNRRCQIVDRTRAAVLLAICV